MRHIPWELRYLITPWRWFGEWGLIEIKTWTHAEALDWLVRTGLAGCMIRLGWGIDESYYRIIYLRFGRWHKVIRLSRPDVSDRRGY